MIRRASIRHELATTRVGLVHDLQAERAKRTDEATSPGGDTCNHAWASRANHRPMDALRRLASRPRHVRHGPMMRMRARHPTRNRVYTLASPRVWRILERFQKKTNKPRAIGAAPGESSDPPAETTFWARPAHARGCLPTGPRWAGRLEGGGGGPGPGRGLPGGPTASYVRVGWLETRRAGPMWVRDPQGGHAHAQCLGGRQAGHCSSSPGPGPCLMRPGT